MAKDSVKSASITNLDATPIVFNNAGGGRPARTFVVDDFCAATAAGVASAGSTYRPIRVPTGSLVDSVTLFTDAALDAASAKTLALDVSWIFSDSTDDGTPVPLQGLIPTSANTGGTTSIASYSSPNKMYGTVIETSNTLPYGPTNVVFNGLGANYSFTGGFMNKPLYELFGFTDGRGNPSDPGGYFDLLVYVATAATTGAAGNIYAKVSYKV